MKLSVVMAVRNEEENIERCLESVRWLADEIIVVDEHSTDNTRIIAEKLGAKVFLEPHHDIFHITKQKALDYATCDWILQLDADEVVSPELAWEIKGVLEGKHKPKTNRLFEEHQRLVEQQNGTLGRKDGDVVGYFLPRRNIFLGKPLIHAGGYPDGVIRLVKRGKARFPQKSVHEQITLNGKVGWLGSDLLHYDSPNLKRYLTRMNRYTDLHALDLQNQNVPKNILFLIYYSTFKTLSVFLNLYIRHRGFIDGIPGFLWSFFSGLHFPIAYFKYWTGGKK